jgi:CheY-like chemotaxis protein
MVTAAPLRILVVDDDNLYGMLLCDALQMEGWQTVHVEGGEQALEAFDTAQFDILITDIYMPGMDGLKLHAAVRARPELQELPVLFISAYADPETLKLVSISPLDHFLTKDTTSGVMKRWINWMVTPVSERGKPPYPTGTKADPRQDPPRSHDDRRRSLGGDPRESRR